MPSCRHTARALLKLICVDNMAPELNKIKSTIEEIEKFEEIEKKHPELTAKCPYGDPADDYFDCEIKSKKAEARQAIIDQPMSWLDPLLCALVISATCLFMVFSIWLSTEIGSQSEELDEIRADVYSEMLKSPVFAAAQADIDALRIRLDMVKSNEIAQFALRGPLIGACSCGEEKSGQKENR